MDQDFQEMRKDPTEALLPSLRELFRDDLPSTEGARTLYRALCNNIWVSSGGQLNFTWRAAGGFVAALRNDLDLPLDDPDTCQRCQKKQADHQIEKYESGLSQLLPDSEPIYLQRHLCSDGGLFTPGYTGPEDYMDYYCSGGEGKIEPWVEEKLQSLGYSRESAA